MQRLGSTPDGSSEDKTLTIAVIPKGTSHEFWKSVHFGAEKAAKELGDVEIEWRGPVVEATPAAKSKSSKP